MRTGCAAWSTWTWAKTRAGRRQFPARARRSTPRKPRRSEQLRLVPVPAGRERQSMRYFRRRSPTPLYARPRASRCITPGCACCARQRAEGRAQRLTRAFELDAGQSGDRRSTSRGCTCASELDRARSSTSRRVSNSRRQRRGVVARRRASSAGRQPPRRAQFCEPAAATLSRFARSCGAASAARSMSESE